MVVASIRIDPLWPDPHTPGRGPPESSVSTPAEQEQGIACTFCESKNFIKRDVRETKSGPKQHYECLNCERKFVIEPDQSKKATPAVLNLVKELSDKGLSSRSIAAAIDYKFKMKIAHQTIIDWIGQVEPGNGQHAHGQMAKGARPRQETVPGRLR